MVALLIGRFHVYCYHPDGGIAAAVDVVAADDSVVVVVFAAVVVAAAAVLVVAGLVAPVDHAVLDVPDVPDVPDVAVVELILALDIDVEQDHDLAISYHAAPLKAYYPKTENHRRVD